MPKNNKNRNNLWVTDAEDFPTNTSVYVNNLALARARYAFTHQRIVNLTLTAIKAAGVSNKELALDIQLLPDYHHFNFTIENLNKCFNNHLNRQKSLMKKHFSSAPVRKKEILLFLDKNANKETPVNSVIKMMKTSLNKELCIINSETNLGFIINKKEFLNVVIEDADPQFVEALPDYIDSISLNAHSTNSAIDALSSNIQAITLYSLNLNRDAFRALLTHVHAYPYVKIKFDGSSTPRSLNGITINQTNRIFTTTEANLSDHELKHYNDGVIKYNLMQIVHYIQQNQASSTTTVTTAQATEENLPAAVSNNQAGVYSYFFITMLNDEALDQNTIQRFLEYVPKNLHVNLLHFCNNILLHLQNVDQVPVPANDLNGLEMQTDIGENTAMPYNISNQTNFVDNNIHLQLLQLQAAVHLLTFQNRFYTSYFQQITQQWNAMFPHQPLILNDPNLTNQTGIGQTFQQEQAQPATQTQISARGLLGMPPTPAPGYAPNFFNQPQPSQQPQPSESVQEQHEFLSNFRFPPLTGSNPSFSPDPNFNLSPLLRTPTTQQEPPNATTPGTRKP